MLQPIFGTDIYTDDSSVCTAALHAGVLSSREAGGIVTVEIRPDPMQYLGTLQNGIASEDWFDHWPSGFVFVQLGDGEGPAPAVVAHARTSGEAWPDSIGRVVSVFCPPKVELLSVFGTDSYTDDTPICSAAVHAGRATHAMGGVVSIVIRPGKPNYPGSSRHGIASMTAESRPASFEFVDTPHDTPAPPTLATPFLRSSGRLEPSIPLR